MVLELCFFVLCSCFTPEAKFERYLLNKLFRKAMLSWKKQEYQKDSVVQKNINHKQWNSSCRQGLGIFVDQQNWSLHRWLWRPFLNLWNQIVYALFMDISASRRHLHSHGWFLNKANSSLNCSLACVRWWLSFFIEDKGVDCLLLGDDYSHMVRYVFGLRLPGNKVIPSFPSVSQVCPEVRIESFCKNLKGKCVTFARKRYEKGATNQIAGW